MHTIIKYIDTLRYLCNNSVRTMNCIPSRVTSNIEASQTDTKSDDVHAPYADVITAELILWMTSS